MMRAISSVALAFLALFAATPAFAQSSQEFDGGMCEIDTSVLNVPNYQAPDGTRSIYTFNSIKQCSGVASKRNILVQCSTPLPDWGARGDKTAKNFPCTINPEPCGLSPKPGDVANPPYVTTRDSILKVRSGVAQLICHYKP
jgi:hypothetical protein